MRMLNHISVIDDLGLFKSPFEDVDVRVVFKLHLKLLIDHYTLVEFDLTFCERRDFDFSFLGSFSKY